MTTLTPTVEYGKLSDADIVTFGLDAAEESFLRDVAAGLTNGDSLAIVLGCVRKVAWMELGRRAVGPNADEFFENIGSDDGKLATALKHQKDSGAAYMESGDDIPEGPQRYTGGAYYIACVNTVRNGWMTETFAGAASGVQGHFDQAAVYAGLMRMAAVWAMKMQQLYGKP